MQPQPDRVRLHPLRPRARPPLRNCTSLGCVNSPAQDVAVRPPQRCKGRAEYETQQAPPHHHRRYGRPRPQVAYQHRGAALLQCLHGCAPSRGPPASTHAGKNSTVNSQFGRNPQHHPASPPQSHPTLTTVARYMPHACEAPPELPTYPPPPFRYQCPAQASPSQPTCCSVRALCNQPQALQLMAMDAGGGMCILRLWLRALQPR